MNLSRSICCFQPIKTNIIGNFKTFICRWKIFFCHRINGNSKHTNASCRTLYSCIRVKFSFCSSPTWCNEVGLSTNMYHAIQLLHWRNNKLNILISCHLYLNANISMLSLMTRVWILINNHIRYYVLTFFLSQKQISNTSGHLHSTKVANTQVCNKIRIWLNTIQSLWNESFPCPSNFHEIYAIIIEKLINQNGNLSNSVWCYSDKLEKIFQ